MNLHINQDQLVPVIIHARNKARDVTVLQGDWQDNSGIGMMPVEPITARSTSRSNLN
jgi:hypothetical protein